MCWIQALLGSKDSCRPVALHVSLSLSVCPHHPPTQGRYCELRHYRHVTILYPRSVAPPPYLHYLDRRPAPITSGQAVTRRKITVIPVASSAAVLVLLLIFPLVLLQPLFLSLSLSLPHQPSILYNSCLPRPSRLSFLFHSSIFHLHLLFDILPFAQLPL